MPSRFVELVTPIEDSVAWAESWGTTLGSVVSNMVSRSPVSNVTLPPFSKLVDSVQSLALEHEWFGAALDGLYDAPKGALVPRGVAAYLFCCAVVVAIVRWIVVLRHASNILRKNGKAQWRREKQS